MATQEQVAERLTELQKDDGLIDPKDVVEDARSPESPLHDQFEWDDGKAAEEHRLLQARRLIRRVKVEIIVNRVPLRAPVYVRDPGNTIYRTIVSMRTDEDKAREAVVAEMRRISNAVKRAKTLALSLGDMEDLIEQIDEIAATIVRRAHASDQPEGTA